MASSRFEKRLRELARAEAVTIMRFGAHDSMPGTRLVSVPRTDPAFGRAVAEQLLVEGLITSDAQIDQVEARVRGLLEQANAA